MKSLEEWFRHVDSYREKAGRKSARIPMKKEGVSLPYNAWSKDYGLIQSIYPQGRMKELFRIKSTGRARRKREERVILCGNDKGAKKQIW